MEWFYGMVQNPFSLTIILIVTAFLIVLLLIHAVFMMKKYRELNMRYISFMSKLNTGEKIDEVLSGYLKMVEEMSEKIKEMDCDIKRLETNLRKCVQKVGIVRYNAYNDTGSDLSFTMALMDAEENGIVLNGLYSRDSSSIFAKPLVKGETKYNLSAEEIQAIDIARASSVARY